MLTEELEFKISQYSDGSLPAEQQGVVEDLLRTDPAAAEVFRQYQKLDLHLIGMRKTYSIEWHRLAEHLSDPVHNESAPANRFSVAGRIIPAMTAWRFRSAVAAVIVCAVGGALWFKDHRSVHAVVSNAVVETAAVVVGPQAEVANGPVVQEISIRPSPALVDRTGTWRYAGGVASHGPSKVTITAGITPVPHADPHLR